MRSETTHPALAPPRPRRRSTRVVPALLAALLVLGATLVDATPSAAQASYVTVSVHTDPPEPEPGDDVAVTVRVASCPPGTSVVELLLADPDQRPDPSSPAPVMAEAAARTSVLWRTKAELELPDAIEGWYGARVRCGSFIPAHVPMANTYFAVGANPTKDARLSATEVAPGGTLRFEGDGCPGPGVEYEVKQYTGRSTPFLPSGTITTNADGTWGGDIAFPADLTPGRATVEARCTVQNAIGETVYVSYGRPLDVTILRAG